MFIELFIMPTSRRRAGTALRHRQIQLRTLILLFLVSAGALALLHFVRPATAATNRTWTGGAGPGNTNWDEPSNWDTGVPDSGEVALFNSGANPATINVSISVAGIEIDSGYTGTITQIAGASITVGDFDFNQAGGVFAGSSNNDPINVNGNFILSGGSFTSTRGTLTLAGSHYTHQSGGTFLHNSGTVTFAFVGSQPVVTLNGSETFNNLNFADSNDDGRILFGTVVAQGALALIDGSFTSNGAVEAQAGVSIAPTFDGGNNTLLITAGDGTPRTITFATGSNLLNVNLNASNVTINTSGSGTLTWRDLTLQAGAINQGNVDFVFAGTGGPGNTQSGGTFNASANAITFNNTFTLDCGPLDCGAFNGGSGNIVMNENFTINGGIFTSTSNTLSIAKNYRNSGTFRNNSGTVTFTGSTSGVQLFPPAGGETFNNLNFDKTTGVSIAVFGHVTATGNLALNDGSIIGGSGNILEAQGGVTIAPAFDGGNDTLSITKCPAGVCLPRTINLAAGTNLLNINLDDSGVTINTSGSRTLNWQSVTLQAGTINQGGVDFVFGVNGFQIFNQSGGTFNGSANSITFNSSVTQSDGVFNGGSGNIAMNEPFTLSAGTFTSTSGTLFVVGGFAHNSGVGTFNHNNGTVTFDSDPAHPGSSISVPDAASASGGETFNNLNFNDLNGGNRFIFGTMIAQGMLSFNDGLLTAGASGPSTRIEARGGVTVASTFDGGNNMNMRFSGSANQIFTNNGGPNLTGAWTINKSTGTVTAASSLILGAGQSLDITSGSLFLSSGSNLTCGALTVGLTGALVSNSATTITLGGDVTNNGVIDLQGGACPQSTPRPITLRSTVAGTRRSWSRNTVVGASARFRIADVDAQDMSASGFTITDFSGTDSGNNLNWTFNSTCPTTVTISPASVNLPAGGTQTFTPTGIAPFTFSLPVNNSGATINASTGQYIAGSTTGVTDEVRVTDSFGSDAEATVSVQTRVPSQLTFQSQPTNATAGQAISPSVTVAIRDQFGALTTATNAVTLAIGTNLGGSTLSGTLTHNAVSGFATFNGLSLNHSAAGYTLQATSGSLSAATSNTFNITAASAAQLAITTQPGNTVAGVAIAPAVQVTVQDQFGNRVTTAANAVTMALGNNAGGASLSGTATSNAVNGIATFNDLSLDRSGNGYTLTATAASLAPATSTGFNITAAAAAKLVFTVQPTNTDAGVAITPAVQVSIQDQFSNLVTTATDQISLAIANNPGGASLSGNAPLAAVGGVATFASLSVSQPGNGHTLNATSGSLAAATSDAFNVHVPAILVTNTNDSGAGSLRQAILDANANIAAEPIRIHFNIAGAPPFSIAPTTGLPAITRAMIIDGATQPGFAGTPIIELNGVNTPGGQGLVVNTNGVTIRGLVINRFGNDGEAILLIGGGNTIQGCYLGTDIGGSIALPNGQGLVTSNGNAIGGTNADEGNVISGNNIGITLFGSNNLIQGNFIGVGADGSSPLGNATHSLVLIGASNSVIGGVTPGAGNVIAFNGGDGLNIPNGSLGNTIRGNRIFSNSGLGINLVPDPRTGSDPANGVTPNLNNHLGGNNRQPYPVLSSALVNSGTSTIDGTLNSSLSSTFTIDFYSNQSCDPTGFGEGENYLGSTSVTTDSSGIAGFTASLSVNVPVGQFITATATDAIGNTSEFSKCMTVAPSIVSISGFIKDVNNAALANVPVHLTGTKSAAVLTGKGGIFSFNQLPGGGNYTVTPVLTNFAFTAPNRTYTTLIANQSNQDFRGTKTSLRIKGTVSSVSQGTFLPLSGVTLTLSGPSNGTATTDNNGNYSFAKLTPGSYPVTPTKQAFTMTPTSTNVTLTSVDATVNFTAQTVLSQLTGRIAFTVANGTDCMDADGSNLVTFATAGSSFPAISPDGQKIAFTFHGDMGRGICLIDYDGSNLKCLTSNAADTEPAWSADSQHIAYISTQTDSLFTMKVDGTSQARVPFSGNSNVSYPTWAPDGVRIAFADATTNISIVNADGSNLTKLTLDSNNSFPSWSPDGTKIVFTHSSNRLETMDPNGSNRTIVVNDGFIGRAAWSPDSARFVYPRAASESATHDLVVSNANGSNPAMEATSTMSLNPSWSIEPTAPTTAGSNVNVQLGGTSITFSGVSVDGATTVTPIPPNSAGTVPGGLVIGGLAFEINTTATVTPPIKICFTVPTTTAPTQTAFNALTFMHNEGGTLVDRTISRAFATRQICGSVNSLSPFALAEQVDNSLPSVNGLVVDADGNPMSDVTMHLTGAEDRFTQTDSDGLFNFVNLTPNGNYHLEPRQAGFLFTDTDQDFIDITDQQAVMFTGTAASFTIAGTVTYADGNPIAGVAISLEDSATTVTDANGNYSFPNMPAGSNYVIEAFQPDLTFSPAQIDIESLSFDQTANFAATSGAPTPTPTPTSTPTPTPTPIPTPTIVAATGLSRQQGSPFGNSQIATVTDQGGNGSVIVAVTSANPSNGVTISNIVNTDGNITADIIADCAASSASFTLQASDGSSTVTDTLNLNVLANTAPTLTYSSPPAVGFNGSQNVSPTAASDNVSITGYAVQGVVPVLTTPPTVNAGGVVSLTNAQPAGNHTITIRATDNCGATTDASFVLTVMKGNQTITFGALANKTFGDPDFGVSATATSGLPVSFAAAGQCTVTSPSPGTVHTTGAGSCIITASQGGNANFNAAPDMPQSFTIARVATSTAFTSSVNPSDFGQSVTFTATVTSGAGTPTGTVQFKDNGNNIGAVMALNGSGVAQVSTSTLTAATHTITADYGGDTNFATSTGTLSGGQVVKAQPSLSIDDVSITEGQSGTKVLNVTVTLSAGSSLPVTANFATADGTATAPTDYVATNGPLTFNPSETTRTIPVTINGDVSFEPDETFTVTLSNPSNATISKAVGTGTIQNDDAQGGFITFSAANTSVNEIDGIVTLTVVRTNDVTQAGTVDYATDDTGSSTNCGALNTGLASQRCDYTSMFGTLNFAASETQKTVNVPINSDGYTEGPETFTVKLTNPTGGAVLATPSTATVTINDSTSPLPNPVDDTASFVRQQYHDFLNRDADQPGLAFWKDNIDRCTDPAQLPQGQTVAQCIEVQRIITSAAFFLSIEFRQTGGLVRDFYVAALDRPLTNNMPGYLEFMSDTQAIQKGVVVGQGNWEQLLAANQTAFLNEFGLRGEFVALYPTTDTPAQYVDKLYLHANVTPGSAQERADAIAEFGGAATAADPGMRGRALLRITQNAVFQARELNRGFVQMQYFGYLRRNPNDPPDGNFNGYNFWLNKLNQFNGDFLQSEMVKAFITSSEYRQRFGP